MFFYASLLNKAGFASSWFRSESLPVSGLIVLMIAIVTIGIALAIAKVRANTIAHQG